MKPAPELWRLRGRPFDPRQRALSRGEQRKMVGERLLYGIAGAVFGGLIVIWLWDVAAAFVR